MRKVHSSPEFCANSATAVLIRRREDWDGMDETRVQLLGGPLDGWPILIRGAPPEELRLPYSRAMLEVAGRPSSAESREEWRRVQFPSEAEALGVGVYAREVEVRSGGVLRYRYVRTEGGRVE